MSNIVVAKRYANALFEVAREKGIISQVEEELKSVAGAIAGNADLQKYLNHPGVDNAAKKELLKQIFGSNVSEPVWNMLQVLIDKGREDIISALVQDYVKIANEAQGLANATVYSAFSLSENQIAEIAAHFKKITGKTLRVETAIDPKLLGGIQVRIGDRLYDGSISGKLDRLAKSLQQSQVL